jgi:RNA polymerase sigma factor (sigma-70 family)
MSDTTLPYLRHQLVLRYAEIKRRLTRRLGRDDLAEDVLQETYLHLDHQGELSPVHSPTHYLVTVATNIARMRLRREKRWVSLDDVDAAVGIVDEAPDPARSTEARLELEALQRALNELTPRRRQILMAARGDGRHLRDIATQLGISQRLVEMELKQALEHCALRLNRVVVQRFGPRRRSEPEDRA